MKQMVVEEQGRRVVVPAGEQFTLETIHDHFWMPVGTEGKPRGWEIDRIGQGNGIYIVFFLKKATKKEREKSLFLFTYFIIRFINTHRTRSVLLAQQTPSNLS